MERRTAISGLMPARPLRMPESVLRLTPRDRATSVTVKFKGSRHRVLSTSPGCGGLCIFIMTSVVVFVIDTAHILPGTYDGDPPIGAHFNGPLTLSGTVKFVEIPYRPVGVMQFPTSMSRFGFGRLRRPRTALCQKLLPIESESWVPSAAKPASLPNNQPAIPLLCRAPEPVGSRYV